MTTTIKIKFHALISTICSMKLLEQINSYPLTVNLMNHTNMNIAPLVALLLALFLFGPMHFDVFPLGVCLVIYFEIVVWIYSL